MFIKLVDIILLDRRVLLEVVQKLKKYAKAGQESFTDLVGKYDYI